MCKRILSKTTSDKFYTKPSFFKLIVQTRSRHTEICKWVVNDQSLVELVNNINSF